MTAQATRPAAGSRAVTLALIVAVLAATALALVPLPFLVRSFVVFPVLVLVAGDCAARLVLGRREPGEASADGVAELDGLLRAVLPVLLGMLSLTAVVLLLAVSGVPIATTSVAVGAGSAALVLLLSARWRTFQSAGAVSGSLSRSAREAARRATWPAVAVLVLAGAVAGAVALCPVPSARYTQLALAEPDVVAGKALSARVGMPVTLRWTLRGYGSALPDAEPAVDVTVGRAPATGVRVDPGRVGPGEAPGVVAERHGTVTFAAPTVAGRYDVRVTVGPETAMVLVVGLEVTS